MTKREELTAKYERNLELVKEFKKSYKEFLDRHNVWDQPTAFNATFTNRQYYEEFIKVTDQEYSVEQHHAIRTIVIQEHFLNEYIAGVDTQYENLFKILIEIKESL